MKGQSRVWRVAGGKIFNNPPDRVGPYAEAYIPARFLVGVPSKEIVRGFQIFLGDRSDAVRKPAH